MDASDAMSVIVDSESQVDDSAGNGNTDSREWPHVCPTRADLDYLEQALTTGIPKPSYDGPIGRRFIPSGTSRTDWVLTLPLETPSHVAQSVLPLVSWDLPPPPSKDYQTDNTTSKTDPMPHSTYLNSKPEPDPEPDFKTCEPKYLMGIPIRRSQFFHPAAMLANNDLGKAARVQSPPIGTFSRPSSRGTIRKESSSGSGRRPTEHEAQRKAAANPPRRPKPSGPRRPVKSKLPQGEAEPAPPETAHARRRSVVTIRSPAAARKWQELEKKEK